MQPLVNAKPLHPHMCDAKMQLALVIALKWTLDVHGKNTYQNMQKVRSRKSESNR